MSGMFQRIARRQTDASDEPETSGDQPTPGDAEAPAATPQDDAPTERIEAVAAPVDADAQPGLPVHDRPTTHQPAVPPPAVDLTSKLAAQPATPPAPTAPAATAATTAVQPEPATTTPAPAEEKPAPVQRRPGFRARGRMRRRLRYLRKLRELQVRDLGGLAFDLRRFERKRDDLIAQKVDQIRACDDELHALELALDERRDVRDVREPGIGGTCPRCFAIFGSADRFCASCGAALGGAAQGPAQVPLTPAPPSAPPPAAPPTAPETAVAPPPAATPPAAADPQQ
jgi:hypothetical protein